MKKVLIIVLLILLLSVSIYAKGSKSKNSEFEEFFTSYMKTGDLSIYASIGYWWGITLNAGADLILGEWKIANIFPLDYAVGARFLFESWSYLGYGSTYWGLAPMFIVHWGWNNMNLDFYEGIGLGFYGYTTNLSSDPYGWSPFGLGFAAVSGVTWYFSKNMGLILEYSYVGYVSTYGVGITMKM